jgi:hypothetical protein
MSTSDVWGTGFTHAPGNDSVGTVLSWHYYCWLFTTGQDPVTNDTIPEFDRVFCDDWQINDYFSIVEKESDRLNSGGPSFLTEFGECLFVDPVTHHKNVDVCRPPLYASDRHFESWTYSETAL